MTFKKLTTLFSNETKQIDSVQMWEVRWWSRHSEYSGGLEPELECFPSEQQAEEFAESLRTAYKLLRHTSGNRVTVKKAKSV